jgi:HlyD family type I secretion membrane fusion protein
MAGEVSAFRTRETSTDQQIGVLGQRSEENARTIEGLRSQRDGLAKQAALIRQELVGVESLYDQGYVPISRLLALRRQAADLEGQAGEIAGRIAQIKASSGENELQGLSLRGQKMSDIVKDLRDVQTRQFDTLERLRAAQDSLQRTVLVAPEAGVVVGLSVHTPGEVIRPGETVMEIVPDNDALDVSIKVRPEDADRVTRGMTARINFSSYRQRRLPIITGTVETISADRLLDDRGQPYFAATVTVDPAALAGYPNGRLIPGMPAEVEVNTGKRTALDYLTEPVTDVFRNGMRER